MPRKSAIERSQSELCAARIKFLDREIFKNRLSDIHRGNHRSTLVLAKRCRKDSVLHAHLLESAKASRFYFITLRGSGE